LGWYGFIKKLSHRYLGQGAGIGQAVLPTH